MLEIYRPRAVMEIRSWQPERQSGRVSLCLEGHELPSDIGAIMTGSLRVLSLAPGEWLLVSNEQSSATISQRIAPELAPQGAVLVDTTDGIGALKVHGMWARDVLSKGCGLDFHPSAFPIGRCARTRFAQMSVIVDHVDDAPTFHIYVARSYLRFLADWIADAAIEFNSSSV